MQTVDVALERGAAEERTRRVGPHRVEHSDPRVLRLVDATPQIAQAMLEALAIAELPALP